MLPLLTGSVRSPRIAVNIEEQEIIVRLDTGAEVSVLPKTVMSELIGDGSRHVKLGESKSVKPFANADVTIEGPWCLSVVVCGVKITHPFFDTIVRPLYSESGQIGLVSHILNNHSYLNMTGPQVHNFAFDTNFYYVHRVLRCGNSLESFNVYNF